MKLRNKKTGEHGEYKVVSAGYLIRVRNCDTNESYQYDCISGFNDNWEDYKPAEPLIKDEKIRKAVRVWAEVNKLEPDFEVRYSENTFSLISWQACIEFNTKIDGLEHDKKYTIAELCGEEEE
jgi:hypothetical protein